MSKVLTFSRVFPSYHPKAGQPTHFVEKIWQSLGGPTHEHAMAFAERPGDYTSSIAWGYRMVDGIKHHTIRAGQHWKVGDWFRPVVWGNDVNPKSGRSGPYHSKQITFAPDIQVKKTWDFEMDACGVCSIAKPGEQQIYTFDYSEDMDDHIAANDGLSPEDFYWWFSRSPEFKKKEGFEGQIICWNENIEYLKTND